MERIQGNKFLRRMAFGAVVVLAGVLGWSAALMLTIDSAIEAAGAVERDNRVLLEFDPQDKTDGLRQLYNPETGEVFVMAVK